MTRISVAHVTFDCHVNLSTGTERWGVIAVDDAGEMYHHHRDDLTARQAKTLRDRVRDAGSIDPRHWYGPDDRAAWHLDGWDPHDDDEAHQEGVQRCWYDEGEV